MSLIADIYEASMLPEFWPTALQRLCGELELEGATLVTIDGPPRWTTSVGMAENMRRYIDGGWHERNEPMEKLLRLNCTGFVRDIDLFSLDEIERMPIVKDFKRPYGFGWSAAMATTVPTGEMLLFSLERLWDRGPISDEVLARLEELRPHISRGALLAAKLQHQTAEAAVESLDMADVPAALVTHSGRVLAANPRFLKFGEQFSIGPFNRLRVASRSAGAMIEKALNRLTLDCDDKAPMSLAIPASASASDTPLVAHVVPTKGRARDLLGARTALLIVSDVAGKPVPPASLLRALFDLTQAESRVAEALLLGMEKTELQARLGVSHETIRSHTKSILKKTGTRRRVDFMRLMGGLGLG